MFVPKINNMNRSTLEWYFGLKRQQEDDVDNANESKRVKYDVIKTSSIQRFVILFLAHEGVQNTDVWEYWKSFSDESELTFCVHAPENPKYGADFCNKYRVNAEWKPSAWCEPSIVYETIKALNAACAMFKNFSEKIIIHLVSGADVPVKPYTLLFKDRSYFSGGSNQWWALTIQNARKIVDIIEGGNWAGFAQKIGSAGCPDEQLIYRVMEMQYIRFDAKAMYTADERDKDKGNQSPAEWRSWDEVKDLMPICMQRMDLRTLLTSLRQAWFPEGSYYPMFCRKIMFELNMDDNLMKYMYDPADTRAQIMNLFDTPMLSEAYKYECSPYMNQASQRITDVLARQDAFFRKYGDWKSRHDAFVKNGFSYNINPE
jgi:hypothetical protein